MSLSQQLIRDAGPPILAKNTGPQKENRRGVALVRPLGYSAAAGSVRFSLPHALLASMRQGNLCGANGGHDSLPCDSERSSTPAL